MIICDNQHGKHTRSMMISGGLRKVMLSVSRLERSMKRLRSHF